MPIIDYEMDDKSPCIFCKKNVLLSEKLCPNCGKKVPFRMSVEDILFMFFKKKLIDARSGGLILGGDDKEDDIPMIAPVGMGVYQVVGRMQGGEFLVNEFAAIEHRKRLDQINSYRDGSYTPIKSIPINNLSKVYNANGVDSKIAIFIDTGSYIVSRIATIKHYEELVELNSFYRGT